MHASTSSAATTPRPPIPFVCAALASEILHQSHINPEQPLPRGAVSLSAELAMAGTPERFPHILWKYGRSVEALRYSVGQESSLPCSKICIRKYLRMAIARVDDSSARERLCAGYVQLEAFITDAEFEIVRELQDKLGGDGTPLRNWLAPHGLEQITARAEAAEKPAIAILMRIAGQMRARERELWGDC